jgi:hypothetical protein
MNPQRQLSASHVTARANGYHGSASLILTSIHK